MLRSLNEIRGYRIHAEDGEIGKLDDFLFDDSAWTIRYFVVDTGGWLAKRLVLVSPESVRTPNWSEKLLPVSLTKERIENSPPIGEHEPVSRQHEMRLVNYYGWPRYWVPTPYPIGAGQPIYKPPGQVEEEKSEGDPHLRSGAEVRGYHIAAADGDIGHVDDFVADTTGWAIRYMLVDTRNWLPGRKVPISPLWISGVNWSDKQVHVELSREKIEASPEFDPDELLDRDYETRLHRHYGRPVYWEVPKSKQA